MEGNEMKEKKGKKEKEEPEDVLKALLPDKKLCCKLYPHQREGVVFFFNAYKNGKSRGTGSRNGVILADEMGLGKSIQVILFLHGMIMNTQEFKNALLIVPAGLLDDWKDKLEKWTPNMNVFIYHHSQTELRRKLRHLQRTGGILLISYSTFIHHCKTLTTYKGMRFVWDCLICDEAHKLKNSATKTHKCVESIAAGFYILITGTPMQNNLREFWSLFSLISDKYLLGTYKTFKNKFEKPIIKGIEADAGPEQRTLGMELQKTLKKITAPFYLRRTKEQIQELRGQPLLDNTYSDQVLHLPKKNEYVIWIRITAEQEAAYRKIADDSPTLMLQSIHSLTAVCTHPRLNSDLTEDEVSGVHSAESGKLTFMLALLERFVANGNFALVFSTYKKILDIIEHFLTQTSWGRNAFLRIDGDNFNDRDKIVRKFQKRGSKKILLLTTSVGAEGLTLTAADCVVFADLSWNQSRDAQAVGRAHRIGQTKEVTTFRLITCGTLEEIIYRKQLFKGSLTKQVVGDEKNPLRYFTQDELKAMKTLQETEFSSTQHLLEKRGAKNLDITEVFGAGVSSVVAASVCGISDHGQLLSACQNEDVNVDMARLRITETVQMSQQEIEAESRFTRKQIGTDLSVRKRVKIGIKSHKIRTPGLPRKYKCYTSPFSGTKKRTRHLSKPWIVDSSDSSDLSADDDVNLSENAVPQTSVTVKNEVICDSVNQNNTSTFMSNTMRSEGNDRITELFQDSTCYDAGCISRPSSCSSPNGSYFIKSCSGGNNHFKSETDRNSDEDVINLSSEMSDLSGKNMCYASSSSDETKQTADTSRSCVFYISDSSSISADESYSEDIIHVKERGMVNHNDQDVKLLCNASVLSNGHGFRSENMMQESELGEPTAFHEEVLLKSVESAEVAQQQTQVIQDEIKRSVDTLEFSDHITKSHPNVDLDMNASLVTDVNEDMSFVTDLEQETSPVAIDNETLRTSASHKHISTPDTTSDSEYCSSDSHNQSTSITKDVSYNCTFPKDSYMDKNESSHLQEASMSTSMSDVSLVQPNESNKLTDQEASSREVKLIEPREQNCLVNGENEETVHPKGHPCNDALYSLIPVPSSKSQEKTTLNQDQELGEDSFKPNQIVPILCDYSLTPSCFSLSVPSSVGKGSHDPNIKQLNECSDLNGRKEEPNLQNVKYSDTGGQKHPKKCDHEQMWSSNEFLDLSKQNLNLAQPSAELSHPSSERETLWDLKDHKPTEISSEDSFKSGLKSHQIPSVLCDYSFTPGCVSMLDPPSVEKGMHGLSEHFQSTPMHLIQAVHQETQYLLKRRLSFSHLHPANKGNSSASAGKPSESGKLKSEKRTECFSPSLTTIDKRKISDLDKKAHTAVDRNDNTVAHNIEEYSFSSVSDTNRLTRTNIQKCPTNRDIGTRVDESRVNTILLNLLANNLSNKHALVRKARRSMFMPKRQHRKKKCGLSLKRNRHCFAVTYQKHKKKVLKSMGNVDNNEVIGHPQERHLTFDDGVTSDFNISPITDERIYASATDKSASLSSTASSPKFSEENSPTQSIQNSTQCPDNEHYYNDTTGMKDTDNSLNDISEGGSVDSTGTVKEDTFGQDHCRHGCLEKAEKGHSILKEDLSTSFTQLSQFTQTATLDDNLTLQECSATNNSEILSRNADDKDDDYEMEDCQNEIFRLMDILKRL